MESGETVLPPARYAGSSIATDVLDYAVFALPDGKWLVHVAGKDGKAASCAALPGRLSVECMFRNEQLATLNGAGSFQSTLTLEEVN